MDSFYKVGIVYCAYIWVSGNNFKVYCMILSECEDLFYLYKQCRPNEMQYFAKLLKGFPKYKGLTNAERHISIKI